MRKRNVILLILGAVLLFFGSFWAMTALMGGSDEVQVPSLLNKTVLEAEELLSAQSLKIVMKSIALIRRKALLSIRSRQPAVL